MTESNTRPRNPRGDRVIRVGALAVGILLFAVALYYINFRTAIDTIGDLGVALPLALLFSGLWHLVRTWAWAWCFPATEEHGKTRTWWNPGPVSFARLARVRLAAEAFSYLTLRGIAGEPLKVVLLADVVDARAATAAVALERIAYVIVTTWIVGAEWFLHPSVRLSPNLELARYAHDPDPVNSPGRRHDAIFRLTFFWTF